MQEKIRYLLGQITYPNFPKDIVSYGFLKDITYENGAYNILIEIPSSDSNIAKALNDKIDNILQKEHINANIHIQTPTKAHNTTPQIKNLAPQIKHFVMVSSGKGGVGKSTLSVNLAIGLAMQGKKVGILDADIYGPNIPRMLGKQGQKPNVDSSGTKLYPLQAHGVEFISMGLLFDDGQSLIWRGPMLMRAITQMLSDVLWGELDVLIIDTPPGTGDAQLSIAQNVPISAGVAIMTPQQVSIDDGLRSLDMFKKLSIPIAGIVENMSSFICKKCNVEYDIFGKGTTAPIAQRYQTKVLGQIPLESDIRKGGDEGKPIIYYAPESNIAKTYINIATQLLDFLEKVQIEKLADNRSIQPH